MMNTLTMKKAAVLATLTLTPALALTSSAQADPAWGTSTRDRNNTSWNNTSWNNSSRQNQNTPRDYQGTNQEQNYNQGQNTGYNQGQRYKSAPRRGARGRAPRCVSL